MNVLGNRPATLELLKSYLSLQIFFNRVGSSEDISKEILCVYII